jgi:LysM repeat protein
MSRYEVSAEDSLFSISLRVGVSMSELRAWNGLSARDPLKVGRSLRLSPP